MIHKLTVFALALLIGSPVCWCGWMHEAKAEKPACCQVKGEGSGHSTSSKQRDDCPCAHAPKVRDFAPGKLIVPECKQVGQTLMAWASVDVVLGVFAVSVSDHWISLHGPPRARMPLYIAHCSLLI